MWEIKIIIREHFFMTRIFLWWKYPQSVCICVGWSLWTRIMHLVFGFVFFFNPNLIKWKSKCVVFKKVYLAGFKSCFCNFNTEILDWLPTSTLNIQIYKLQQSVKFGLQTIFNYLEIIKWKGLSIIPDIFWQFRC